MLRSRIHGQAFVTSVSAGVVTLEHWLDNWIWLNSLLITVNKWHDRDVDRYKATATIGHVLIYNWVLNHIYTGPCMLGYGYIGSIPLISSRERKKYWIVNLNRNWKSDGNAILFLFLLCKDSRLSGCVTPKIQNAFYCFSVVFICF